MAGTNLSRALLPSYPVADEAPLLQRVRLAALGRDRRRMIRRGECRAFRLSGNYFLARQLHIWFHTYDAPRTGDGT